jgi:hypothetical protein
MAAPRDKSHDESLPAALTDPDEATAFADAVNQLEKRRRDSHEGATPDAGRAQACAAQA